MLSSSPITAIISSSLPSAQCSVYPNVSWGEHSREASSINTLLSLSPSLIFSPFYHSRSLLCLSMGYVGLWLSGWNRKKSTLYIMCLFWRLITALLASIRSCADALLLLEFDSCSVHFCLQKSTSITKDCCNLFTIEEVPTMWDVNNVMPTHFCSLL